MLTPGIVNPHKKNISGTTFHMFVSDVSTRILFDDDFVYPIMYGSPGQIIRAIKKFDEIVNSIDSSRAFNENTFIKLYSYNNSATGYKLKRIYQGTISKIGREIF